MSYHHCPIEPSDWSNGPDDGNTCEECCGEGKWINEVGVEMRCLSCGGKGYFDGGDYEPQMDDVI